MILPIPSPSQTQMVEADLFRLLVDQVIDYAIFVLNPNGYVVTWNAGAQRLKGYTAREIVGQHFTRFYTEEARAAGRPRHLLGIARDEGRVEDEGWRVRKDGSRFWADVVITALRDDKGRLIGYAKVTRDLTERRQAEEDRAARMAAERAAQRIERLQVATAALAAAIRPETAAEVLIDVAMHEVGARSGAVLVTVSDGALRETLAVRAPTRGTDVVSEAFPLVLAGRQMGVLELGFDKPRSLDVETRGFLLALADVGAQALDRAQLYAAEQEAVRTRDEFLAAAAHDLKTPLATTKGIAQLLRHRIAQVDLEGGQRFADGLLRIDHSVDRMTALINELLDLARLQLGRPLDLERQATDLPALVRHLFGDYEANAPRHTFRLIVGDEAILGNWDPVRIRRVLENLISNAVKYSPDGSEVIVRLDVSDANHERAVVIQVTDHGVGIPRKDLPHVFERFRRGENVAFIHGTGIGLGIVQSIVQQHGGSVDVESVEGKGSTFTVRLPLE